MTHTRFIPLPALVVCIAAALVLRCSMPAQISGGGSDTEITGKILNTNGVPSPHTVVYLIPHTYNPMKADTLIHPLRRDTTDSMGRYCFKAVDTGAIFNLQALHAADSTGALIRGIKTAPGITTVDDGILSAQGALRIFLPDTVDTAAGYLFIEGSLIARGLSGGTYLGGTHYLVVIDPVPSGVMPPVLFVPEAQTHHQFLVSNVAVVQSNDTTDIGFALRPAWRFSLIVAVDKIISDFYGGLSATLPLIESQLRNALHAFNVPGRFQAIIHFSVDSAYEYRGSIHDEMVKPLGKFHYRLLFDTESGIVTKRNMREETSIKRFSNIYLLNEPEIIFDASMTRILIPLLAELRGCLHLTLLNVDSTKNPVNAQGYYGANSYMNVSYSFFRDVRVWDDYSVKVLNYNTTTIGAERNILYTAFPRIMGIIVNDSAGYPLEGAVVRVYGSALGSDSITTRPILQDTTGANGALLFVNNPFKPVSANTITYGNLLVQALSGSDTVFAWFPLTEASEAWFKNPDTTFFKEVTF